MVKHEPLPSPPPTFSPSPPQKRRRRADSPASPSPPSKIAPIRTGPTVPWDLAEDAIVKAEATKRPPTAWAKVSEMVTALGICPRSDRACSQRWKRNLQHDDPSTEQLTELEVMLLDKAVKEVETGKEKWWCIAARYAELGKGKDVRALGKGGVKKWSEVLTKRRKREHE